MKVWQECWSASGTVLACAASDTAQLVLAFAAAELVSEPATWARLRARWPSATLVLCSTAGEICGTRVLDGHVVATALDLEHTRVRSALVALDQVGGDPEAGSVLADALQADDLQHVFVISDGIRVNGSELVRALSEGLPRGVGVTGGLAGDGTRFARTYVCRDHFEERPQVVAIGFYGTRLKVGLGSLGGWDPFGPERRITRASGNVLYELDHRPALDLYVQYLGEHAADLPASGLLFPLTVRKSRDDPGVVRTILAFDRKTKSLTFAGDVPVGHLARLMRTNIERLLDGARGAARTSHEALEGHTPALAILVSCVGRKLVLGQRTEEEIEQVSEVVGPGTMLTGFYSYGEISPFTPSARCELHNQTMTVTTLLED